MRELLPQLEDWLKDGERVAIATVVSTWGSAPRPAGSYMAISERGEMAGSVSGGCVESAVVNAAKEVLKDQKPQRLHFNVADETAWNVGLSCGGEIDIFVHAADKSVLQDLLPKIKADLPVAISTVISGPGLGEQSFAVALNGANGHGESEVIEAQPVVKKTGEVEEFVNPIHPSPTLIMIGGVHIAAVLAKLADEISFRTIVIDPRKAFASTERFENVDQVLNEWPQHAMNELHLTKATAVTSLSHDPKIDDPALIAALQSPAFYVGALGSSRTQTARRERLRAAGISEENLDRLHAPIGIEIGAETPEEIALAIMAQVIAEYRKENKRQKWRM
jgi:xanthine dehydrogenase accessory factor